jgi:hypothetical protein
VYKQIEKEDSMSNVPMGSTVGTDEDSAYANPNVASKRLSPTTTGFNSIPQSGYATKRNAPLSSTKANTIFGSTREVRLSGSLVPKLEITKYAGTDKPIFKTSFKTHDNKSLRAMAKKDDPIMNEFLPPKNHMFRDDIAPWDKMPFIVKIFSHFS